MTFPIKQLVQYLMLSGLLFAVGCGASGPDAPPSVTIDVRCASSADCPRGFSCSSDVEHGPPITLCESTDPAATCPPGYDTKVIYGQTLCKPPLSVTRAPREGRAGDHARHRHSAP